MDPIPIAPRYIGDKCPINAVSTADNKGIEILLMILGMASLRISLFNIHYFDHPHTRSDTYNPKKDVTFKYQSEQIK